MFGVILAIAVTVTQGNVFWRASSVPFVKEHVPRRLLVGAGLALWASFFLGSGVSRFDGRSGGAPGTLEHDLVGHAVPHVGPVTGGGRVNWFRNVALIRDIPQPSPV